MLELTSTNFKTEVLVGPGMYERKIDHRVVILATVIVTLPSTLPYLNGFDFDKLWAPGWWIGQIICAFFAMPIYAMANERICE